MLCATNSQAWWIGGKKNSAGQHMILLQRILRDPRNNKNNLVYWILGIRLMNESWHRMFLAVRGLAVERLLEKGVARLSWPSLRCLLLLLQHCLLLFGCCLGHRRTEVHLLEHQPHVHPFVLAIAQTLSDEVFLPLPTQQACWGTGPQWP